MEDGMMSENSHLDIEICVSLQYLSEGVGFLQFRELLPGQALILERNVANGERQADRFRSSLEER